MIKYGTALLAYYLLMNELILDQNRVSANDYIAEIVFGLRMKLKINPLIFEGY